MNKQNSTEQEEIKSEEATANHEPRAKRSSKSAAELYRNIATNEFEDDEIGDDLDDDSEDEDVEFGKDSDSDDDEEVVTSY